jgi:hypothetical protein
VAPHAADRGPRRARTLGAVHPLPAVARAAQPLPKPRPVIERPAVHLHFHGVNAEDVAAIIRQQQPAAQPAIEED